MSLFQFPNQRIKESAKNEDWHVDHIMNYVMYSASSDFTLKKAEMVELYYAAAAMLSPKQEIACKAMITERYGSNFGPQYFVYPLIENRISQVVGDYRKRPLKRRALVNNEGAIIKKLEAKIDMLLEKELREINKEMEPELGFAPETPKPQMQLPADIEEYYSKDYRTASEEIAEDVLYQLLVVKKEKEKIYNALEHYLTAGHVFGIHDEKNGHPSVFIPHPLDCFFDSNDNQEVQDDMQYFIWDKPMSINEILNMFELSEDEAKIVESYSNIENNGDKPKNSRWFITDNNSFRPRVISMTWLSRKVSKFKVITNSQTKKEEYKILPDDYKITKRDRDEKSVINIEIEDVRHITMLGPELVLSYGSLKDQMKTVGNKKKRFIPAVGLISKNQMGIGNIRSLAKKLVYLQDFASEILYEIRLNMRQLDGNVLVYDMSNIPKEWARFGPDKALEKVNFYLKRDRMQLINSKDKRSNAYANSANVSQKGRMPELISLLSLIEDMADRISGITKEGQGQANPYQKATTTEVNLSSGTARAEEYYGVFDSFVETYLERMIMKSKSVYKEGDVFTYFGGDNQMKFLRIMDDYMLDDLGIHIGDNRKEFERKDRMDKVGEQAFGQSQDPEIMMNMIKMWNADSATEAEAIFKAGSKKLAEMRQENIKLQQEAEANAAKAEEAKQMLLDKQHKEKMQNNLDVAHIYADNKIEDVSIKEAGLDRRKAVDLQKELVLNDAQTDKDLLLASQKNNKS